MVTVIVHAMMMVMMTGLGSLRHAFHRGLHVLYQRFKGVLCAGGIIGAERSLQVCQITVERGVVAEQLAQWIGSGVVLQITLKRRQSGLGRGQVSGLNVAADAFEIAEQLVETVRG